MVGCAWLPPRQRYVRLHASYRCVQTHTSDNLAGVSEHPAGEAAWRAVLTAQNAALRAIEADLATAGVIPLSWYDVLLELHAAPDR